LTTETKNPRNTDAYKPRAIPEALKVIKGSTLEKLTSNRKEIEKHSNIDEKGRDNMNDQEVVKINGASFALLVKNLEQTVKFYSDLGFKHEVIGSKVKHHHVKRDKLTLILFEAREEDEVKPISSRYEEQYFDVCCYTNAVDVLAQEIVDKNITIVRKPNYTSHWSEFTFRDINGYQITIGGGIVNKELISGE